MPTNLLASPLNGHVALTAANSGQTILVRAAPSSMEERGDRGGWVGCIASALSVGKYQQGLTNAGFTGVGIEFTQQAADGIHSAIVKATKPVE